VQYARLQFGDLPSRHRRGHPAVSKELVPPAFVGGIFTSNIPQIQELAINQRDQLQSKEVDAQVPPYDR
jgi:hypothetical protein